MQMCNASDPSGLILKVQQRRQELVTWPLCGEDGLEFTWQFALGRPLMAVFFTPRQRSRELVLSHIFVSTSVCHRLSTNIVSSWKCRWYLRNWRFDISKLPIWDGWSIQNLAICRSASIQNKHSVVGRNTCSSGRCKVGCVMPGTSEVPPLLTARVQSSH